jgi:hypothetical protein
MTMHMMSPAFTTTGKKRAKFKYASAEHKRQAEQLEQDWQVLKKSYGAELDEKKRKSGLIVKPLTITKRVFRGQSLLDLPSLSTGVGTAVKTDIPIYTGDKMIGIGVLHKSNAVPVFSDEEAVDISKMRRG